MATQLTMVNNILRRLRETEVSSVASTDYSKFIGQLVNDACREMNDMWFWTVNTTSEDTSILSDGTIGYALTSPNDRSFMIRSVKNDKLPMAYDITADEEAQLTHIPYTSLLEFRNGFKGTVPTVTQPIRFCVYPNTDGTWQLQLEQGSSTARTWRTWWYIPQDDLALDGSANTTTIQLPNHPVELLALYMAQYERGEAQPGGLEEQKAHIAVASAMEIDMQTNLKSDVKDMTNLEMLRNQLYQGEIW